MNVRATDYYAGGKWIISFSISYSASVKTGLKIAMALYRTEAPFLFYDADNLLHILKETGQVRILPFTFHDYLGGDDDEGVFDLPYIEECDADAPITLSEIRHRIENKYHIYLSVYREDGYKGYYYIKPSKANKFSDKKSKKHFPTFNEAMKALILSIKDLKLDQ